MLKEPRQSDDGLSASKGRHFSVLSKIRFRQPRKKPHRTMKAAGKGLGKAIKETGKFMKEVYREG